MEDVTEWQRNLIDSVDRQDINILSQIFQEYKSFPRNQMNMFKKSIDSCFHCAVATENIALIKPFLDASVSLDSLDEYRLHKLCHNHISDGFVNILSTYDNGILNTTCNYRY